MEHYKNLSLENLPNEEWRDVVGYEGLYQVSNLGRVKKIGKKQKWGTYERTQKTRIVSQFKKENGYLSLHLCCEKREKNAYTHRLVVEAFIRPMKEKEEVNHLDKIKTNNNIENLEICTHLENYLYSKVDIFNATSKKVYRYTIDGYFNKEYSSVSEASKDNNVMPSSIVRSCKGDRNLANNHYFRYEKYDKIKIQPKKYKNVIAIDSKGNKIEFSSAFEASEYFGVKYNSIVSACTKQKECKKHKFQYKQ